MFKVYVLHSLSFDKIYIGYTSDLPNRLISHNALGTNGFTLRYRPWVLIHTEEFQTKKEALIREKQLKSAKGREFVWNLIKKNEWIPKPTNEGFKLNQSSFPPPFLYQAVLLQ